MAVQGEGVFVPAEFWRKSTLESGPKVKEEFGVGVAGETILGGKVDAHDWRNHGL